MDKRIIMLAALAFTAFACGDDDDPTPPGIIIKNDGSTTLPPLDASVGIDSSVTPLDSSVGDSGQTPTIKGAPGCFAGKPTESKQFLNSCAEGFVEFDNTKRLPGFTGTLPPLQ